MDQYLPLRSLWAHNRPSGKREASTGETYRPSSIASWLDVGTLASMGYNVFVDLKSGVGLSLNVAWARRNRRDPPSLDLGHYSSRIAC